MKPTYEELEDELRGMRAQAHLYERLSTQLREQITKLRGFADLIATGFDHDGDAHKYGTPCRVCFAEKVLSATPPAADIATPLGKVLYCSDPNAFPEAHD